MTEDATIKEMVDFINSSLPIDWDAEAAHIRQIKKLFSGPKTAREATVVMPCLVVRYYPVCDCGAPALVRIETPYEPFLIVTSEYMETCYECGVVSSD